SGIESDGALLDFDYREVRVAQAIIANSRKVLLVADHSKFNRNTDAIDNRIATVDVTGEHVHPWAADKVAYKRMGRIFKQLV
ncbi:hypothetical protein C2W62_54220, partial [Candidatus Entotheonella serta]